MAKQIKIIKCPNCGSIQKTELKPDHYHCDNCQTEYFLDNDDININVNHQNQSTPKTQFFSNNQTLKLVASAIIVIVVGGAIKLMLTDKAPTPPSREVIRQVQNNLPSGTTSTNLSSSNTTEEPKKYQRDYRYCSTVLAEAGPYILALEDHKSATQDNNTFFTIYDLAANKKVDEQPLDALPKDNFGRTKFEYLDFSDTKTYFVINDSQVYLLDKTNYKFSNITSSLLNNHPDYQTGLASISLSQTTSGYALHILTNDGKKIYYYPLIDEVYLDDYDFQMVKNRPKKAPYDTSEHVAYDFANRNGEDNKLIKYTYISYDGKPHLSILSSQAGSEKLVESGKHTDDNSAYDILIDSAYSYNNLVNVIQHQNLTPGRLYFDPSVLYSDKDYLIIKTKINAAPGSGYNYQQLDVNTGAVLWTISDKLFKINEIMPYKDKFIAKNKCDNYAIIDKSGNIQQNIVLTQ